MDELKNRYKILEGRYKLFTSGEHRMIVFNRLKSDLLEAGMASPETHIILGLVAGKVYQSVNDNIQEYFKKSNWFFWGPEDIRSRVKALAQKNLRMNQQLSQQRF